MSAENRKKLKISHGFLLLLFLPNGSDASDGLTHTVLLWAAGFPFSGQGADMKTHQCKTAVVALVTQIPNLTTCSDTSGRAKTGHLVI